MEGDKQVQRKVEQSTKSVHKKKKSVHLRFIMLPLLVLASWQNFLEGIQAVLK